MGSVLSTSSGSATIVGDQIKVLSTISPRALHLVDRHGDFYERDVLLEKIAWILNPAQKRAMFKGLDKKIEEEFQYCRPISASVYEGKDVWWYTPDVQKSLNLGKVDALPDRAKEFFFASYSSSKSCSTIEFVCGYGRRSLLQ